LQAFENFPGDVAAILDAANMHPNRAPNWPAARSRGNASLNQSAAMAGVAGDGDGNRRSFNRICPFVVQWPKSRPQRTVPPAAVGKKYKTKTAAAPRLR